MFLLDIDFMPQNPAMDVTQECNTNPRLSRACLHHPDTLLPNLPHDRYRNNTVVQIKVKENYQKTRKNAGSFTDTLRTLDLCLSDGSDTFFEFSIRARVRPGSMDIKS